MPAVTWARVTVTSALFRLLVSKASSHRRKEHKEFDVFLKPPQWPAHSGGAREG